jgi:hypothetical protein
MDGRANHLDKAIAYIEESTTIRRDLGLKADLGISLGTANLCFRSKSYVSGNPEDKALFLRAAADCSEEAAQIFREIGQARFLLQAVLDAVINLRMLWELGIAEPDRIAALCKEGSQLAEQMEEKEAMAFFARLGNPIKS